MRVTFFLIVLILFISCNEDRNNGSEDVEFREMGLLLTTRFNSFEEFKEVVDIVYSKDRSSWVRLTHTIPTQTVQSILKSGVSEKDLYKVRDGSLWDKIKLGLQIPYFVSERINIHKVFILSRRRDLFFGAEDIAFYDVAKKMMDNIYFDEKDKKKSKDFSEKGYINTFNHLLAQTFITSMYSEDLADFIADIHERKNMSELITGQFSAEQLLDINNGPVDNYVDMINNEWGQEIGKLLKKKYNIDQETYWTPELLADFLNDIQRVSSISLKIPFTPFKPNDELCIRFSSKINIIQHEGVYGLR